jgi:hypothetical protein
MGLNPQNVAIVPTPSGILDGHFPDGNDGTGGIPLTWSTVPPFQQKQQGTPFSVNVFTLYLTQPGGATASITPGFSLALAPGWSLASNGLLSYSGTGVGAATIRVRATLGGNTSDSNVFDVSSIAAASSDTIPPTSVTGLFNVSKTTNQAVMNSDVPADVSTLGITASGLSQVRWFKGGVLDGSTSYGPGLLQRAVLLNLATASGSRKLKLGHYTVFLSGQTTNGIPNPTHVWDTGPITANTAGLVVRYAWTDLETSQGSYNFSDIIRDLKTCSASAANGGRGVMLFGMIIQKTFGGLSTVAFTGDIQGQNHGTLTTATKVPAGTYGALFAQGATDILRLPVTVASDQVSVTWSGNLPSGTVINGADFVNTNTSPLPNYMLQASLPYHGAIGTGWIAKRWDTTLYLPRFQALMNALAATTFVDPTLGSTPISIDAHPNFAGIATQETANGGADIDPAYSQQAYEDGLVSESNYISSACVNSRHLCYINFMTGNTTTATTHLKSAVARMWPNGMILAGPDLVTSGSIVNPRCYPIYQAYHDGTAGPQQTGPGYTGCSIQPAEWAGIQGNGQPFAPADGSRTIEDLFQYGQIYTASTPTQDSLGRAWTVPSHLKLDIMLVNWVTGANAIGENFSNAAAPMFANHPPPFGTLTEPSGTGMTPGTVVQTNADYAVTSFGTGINSTDDQWACASESVNGDVTVICKITGTMTGTDLTSSPVMGICLRELATPQSKAVYLVATSSQLRSRYRISGGSSVVNLIDTASQGWNVAKWLKITRVGNTFSFFYSLDGITWIAVGSTTAVVMQPTVFIQFFAGTTGTSSVTGTFQQVNVQQLAKINYTFAGLASATQYSFTAVARDVAGNDSVVSPAILVTTN